MSSRSRRLGNENTTPIPNSAQGSKNKNIIASGSTSKEGKKSNALKTSGVSTRSRRMTKDASTDSDDSASAELQSESISEASDPVDEELADLVKVMRITPKSAAVNSIPNSVLYYGWFFSSSVSSSLKLIADKYFGICFTQSPNFEKFIKHISGSANITDPFDYYKRTIAAKEQMYHVTAKFCDRLPCISYAQLVHDFIGKEFNLEIIGLFFTPSTYGFRLKLSESQESLFDEERVITKKSVQPKPKSKQCKDTPSRNKLKQNGADSGEEIDSEYYGIRMKPQEKNFSPSLSRAHITLGCAPGVKAMQTGLDLIDIISLENRKTLYSDTEIEGATLRQYGRGNGDAFVIYFDYKYIASGIFMAVP